MHQSFDLILLQELRQAITLAASHHKKMMNMTFGIHRTRHEVKLCIGYLRVIGLRDLLPTAVEPVEPFQSNAENGRLQFIQSAVRPKFAVVITFLLAVIA